MPQTKFVLSKALKGKLKPIVVLNKMDRENNRADEVENEVSYLSIHPSINAISYTYLSINLSSHLHSGTIPNGYHLLIFSLSLPLDIRFISKFRGNRRTNGLPYLVRIRS